jgi:hypothetical protein
MIAHEMRHIQQFYLVDSDYKPQEMLPSQETVNEIKEGLVKKPDGTMTTNGKDKYRDRAGEVDARLFEEVFTEHTFGEDRYLYVPSHICDKAIAQVSVRKDLMLLKAIVRRCICYNKNTPTRAENTKQKSARAGKNLRKVVE